MEEKNKSLTKNTIFYIMYNILNIVFPLLTGIYAARILLPDSIGLVESAKNLVQYFVILSFLGIPTYGLREISKYRNNKNQLNKVYSELMIINFISTLLFWTVYNSLIFVIPNYDSNLNLYLIVGLLIFLNFFNNSWLYEGLEEFKFISIRNLIFKTLSFILLILFVKTENDFLWYASITVFGTAGNYLWNIINAKKYVKFQFKNLNIKRHLKSIMFLVFVNLAIEIYTLVDVTMISFLCEKSNVAYYSYGIKIHRILIQFINTFTMVIVPRISLLYKEKQYEEYNALLTKTLKIILLLSIPIIIGIWFVSDYAICLLYGNNYITSAYVIKILSLSLIISPIGYLLGSRVMLVTDNETKMIIPVSLGAITNVILNLILIPKYNEIGASIASIVGELVVMITYMLYSRKYFLLNNVSKTLKNIILASSAMVLFLFFTNFLTFNENFVFLIQIIGSIIIYFILLVIFKENEVIEIINKLLRKLKNRSEKYE